MKSFVRISALLWADILVGYALFVMQNYLTDVWKLSFTRAAGILNILGGISMVLPVFFRFLVDALLGNFKMLVISSVAYSVGIGFVTMSTPPVLASSTGTCKKYERRCIGNTQKVLFYTGMALITVGFAGNLVSVKAFLDEQNEESNDNAARDNKCGLKECLRMPGFLVVVVIPVVGAIALPKIKPWSLRFGIPAICTAVATLLFFSGCRTYNIVKPFPLRCVEKAATMSDDEDPRKTKWRLCSAAQVEGAKIAVRIVPMWMTFIVCGIVSSIGNTYFVEQSKNMNRNIGKLKAPPQILLLVQNWAKLFCFSKLADSLVRKCAAAFVIAVAMISSVLCCITAAKIETRRLRVVGSHGLLKKPDEVIHMSMFWLLFQFLLLAGLDSFLEKGVAAFFDDRCHPSMKKYVDHCAKAVSGLGFMFSVLSVYVVGRISEKVGTKNWFQHDLINSRLDRYYWVLAALSSVNLVVFILVVSCYKKPVV